MEISPERVETRMLRESAMLFVESKQFFALLTKRQGILAEEYWSRDQKEFLNGEFDQIKQFYGEKSSSKSSFLGEVYFLLLPHNI